MNRELPDFNRLKPVELSDRAYFEDRLAVLPTVDSDRSFPVIFAWAMAHSLKYITWQDRIVIYDTHRRALWFPTGEWVAPEELAGLVRAARAAGLYTSGLVYDVPPKYQVYFPRAIDLFDFRTNRNDADYVYDAHKLVELRGEKLRKRRNLIRQFVASYPNWHIEPICHADVERMRAFCKCVNKFRGVDERYLDREHVAMERSIRNIAETGAAGMLLVVNGQIASMAILSKISDAAYDVNFERNCPSIKGAAQMLVLEEARAIISWGGQWMNREEDLGVHNLRKAKEAWDPAFLYERQEATLR